MSLSAGEMYSLDFLEKESEKKKTKKTHSHNIPGGNTNANAGLLAGVRAVESHKVRAAGRHAWAQNQA